MRRAKRFTLCPFSYTYTATGKVLTETDVLGHTARWTYDENSRTKTYTDRNTKRGDGSSVLPRKPLRHTWETEVGTTVQNNRETVTKNYVVDYLSMANRDIMVYEEGSFTQRHVYDHNSRRISTELSYAEGTQRGEPGENIASDTAVRLQKVWYRTSHLDSTLFALDEQGEVVTHTIYDPWGNPQSETKTDLNYTGLDNRNNYTGYTWDVTLELYFAQARFYDPENHRFTQEDPIKDGENWYIYVGNMPLVYVDPSGYAIAVGIVLAAQKTMEAALAALLLVAAVYLVSPDGQAAMQDFASALGVAIRDFTTTASDWGGQIEDASIYFQEVSCSLRDAVNTMVVETATNVKERIEPNGQTIYVHYDTTDYKVHYVGRTKDYWRRRNEHARINIFGGYASSHPIGKDLNREMMPIFTGLDQVQARIVEQLLITAFTIQALDNARNEIAEAKWDSAWSELNRVGSLTKDYLDAVKNPIATLIKDIFK